MNNERDPGQKQNVMHRVCLSLAAASFVAFLEIWGQDIDKLSRSQLTAAFLFAFSLPFLVYEAIADMPLDEFGAHRPFWALPTVLAILMNAAGFVAFFMHVSYGVGGLFLASAAVVILRELLESRPEA
jgi:hypothetical protein